MKPKVLLIGSFLSGRKGTMGVSEKLAISELSDRYEFILASTKLNQGFRLIDMIFRTIIFRGSVVHIDTYSGKAFFYADVISRLAKCRNKKLLMTLRGGALPEYTERRKRKVQKVLRRADKLLSPSKYLIDFYKRIDISVDYLPNPIELDRFPYAREEVKPHSLLWVRAFTSIYNPEIPVRVLYELIKEFPDATLTMVGPDKGMLTQVQNLTKTLQLEEKVVFTGPVPNEELNKYYQTHHVFLNTTSYESFGVAVAEAAACGIPIVSNAVGEMHYIWDKSKEIFFVENNNIQTYIEEIKKLFNNSKLVSSLSEQARKKAESFDLNEICLKWNELFRN